MDTQQARNLPNPYVHAKPNWNKPYVLKNGFPPKPVVDGYIITYNNQRNFYDTVIPSNYEGKKFISGSGVPLVPIGNKIFQHRLRYTGPSLPSNENYVNYQYFK